MTDAAEPIRVRRAVFDFRTERVPDDLLMRILEAGAWAPNHRLTQPWRFIAVGPQTGRMLAIS